MTVKLKKQFYINGEWIDPKKTNDLEVIDPSTEEVCAIISLGSEEDTNLFSTKASPINLYNDFL